MKPFIMKNEEGQEIKVVEAFQGEGDIDFIVIDLHCHVAVWPSRNLDKFEFCGFVKED